MNGEPRICEAGFTPNCKTAALKVWARIYNIVPIAHFFFFSPKILFICLTERNYKLAERQAEREEEEAGSPLSPMRDLIPGR